jgi:TonB family protein
MKRALVVLAFATFAAAWLAAGIRPGPGEEGIQASPTAPAAFELQMRILEGSREKPSAASPTVTSSYLEFVNSSNFEDETNTALDDEIKNVYSLKDVSLLSEANLVWEKGKASRAFHLFRINAQEYTVVVTPGRPAERNHFHIQVFEQGREAKASLLDTEFSLPDRTAAVFGFQAPKAKSYFITLRVARWTGEPAAASGSVAGGAVAGVLDLTRNVKPPQLVKKVDPVYPQEAKKAGVEGAVVLEGTTDNYGRVASVKVLRGVPLLDQAAIDALKQWVYEPMVVGGKPQPITFTVTMRFRLDEKKPGAGGVVGGVVAGDQEREEFEKGAIRAIGDIKPPKLIMYVEPVHPPEARKAGLEGLVILEVRTDEKGGVVAARVLRSVPALDQAAIDAVKQWKFEPLIVGGKARQAVFTVGVRVSPEVEGPAEVQEKFAAGAVKAEGEIKPPGLIKQVVPSYPEAARVAGVQGVIILGVRTDESGKVVDVMVLRSIPLLDQAAIDAVKQWVYEPFVLDGKPRPCVFAATVRFVLK